jgi:peptidoglycan hydrolase-like protein with peptidoglycan-binding domain
MKTTTASLILLVVLFFGVSVFTRTTVFAASIDIGATVLDFGELTINQESTPKPLEVTYVDDVIPTPTPTVSVGASPSTVTSSSPTTLSWSSTNATSCSASGGWSGTKSTSGTESTSALASTSIFTLTCTGQGGTATGNVTVVVNPLDTIGGGSVYVPPVSSGGGGGGGGSSYTPPVSSGGGGGSSYTPPVSSGGGSSYFSPASPSSSTGGSGSDQSTPSIIFTRTINVGSKDTEVEKLQRILSSDPSIYPEGTVTGFYGPATQKAVEKFQAKYGVVSFGTPSTTGYGNVGSKTIQKLNEVFASATPPSATNSNVSTNTSGCTASTKYSPITGAPCPSTSSGDAAVASPLTYTYTRTLSLGMRGPDVTLLQTILARDTSLYPEAQITGYYGPATQKAVQRLQVRNNIINYGTPASTGDGAVGKKTALVVGK